MKVSLIIPAYNEEKYIIGCLDSITKQKIMPDEVIVVNNNCSDSTLSIVKRYSFVKIVNETNNEKLP